MTKIQELIFKSLKDELEYQGEAYSQWIMAVSMIKEASVLGTHCTPSFVARLVVKTSESPYVDGTDVGVIMVTGEALIDTDSLDGPIFHGGTVKHALDWVKELEEPFYLQMENPFEN